MSITISPVELNFSYAASSLKKQKDLLDVTTGFLADEWPTAAKAVYVGIDCMKEANLIPESQQETFDDARYHFNLIKLAGAPRSFFRNFSELRSKAGKYWENDSWYKAGHALLAANKCIGPIYDGTDFLSKAVLYLPKHAPWFRNFTGVNALSLIITMTYNSYINVTDIISSKFREAKNEVERQPEREKLTKALFELIKNVSYLALGVLSFLTVFFAFVFSSVVLTALSASTVVFHILHYYYKNLGTPLDSK